MAARFSDDEITELMSACDEKLRGWCRRNVGDVEQADELWQDAKLTAWEKRESFEGRSKFCTWMIEIAKYKLWNLRRKRKDVLTEDGILDDDEPGITALKELRRDEREAFVLECVASLDPVEQEVAFLRYGDEMPLEQIDALVDIKIASGSRGVLQRVKRKLCRARCGARLAEMGHGSSFVRTNW